MSRSGESPPVKIFLSFGQKLINFIWPYFFNLRLKQIQPRSLKARIVLPLGQRHLLCSGLGKGSIFKSFFKSHFPSIRVLSYHLCVVHRTKREFLFRMNSDHSGNQSPVPIHRFPFGDQRIHMRLQFAEYLQYH